MNKLSVIQPQKSLSKAFLKLLLNGLFNIILIKSIMKYSITFLIFILIMNLADAKEYVLFSPDKKTKVRLSIQSDISLKADYLSQELFRMDKISLTLADHSFISKVKSTKTNSVERKIYPVIKEKYSVINEKYNELTMRFKGNYTFVIRAYNEGIAYRFQIALKDSVIVNNENFNLEFAQQDSVWFQKSGSFNSSYETPYQHSSIKDLSTEGYYCLPVLVKKQEGVNLLITESNLVDFPGLWFKATENSSFAPAHAGYPLSFKYEGSPYGQGQVKEHAGYIAKTKGKRNFPWRVFIIAENDGGLMTNTLVYQLAEPSQIEDVSWIKPGVVTFDWWGRRNIYGTGFKSGVNTETAKYFIDFASEFGFEYFLFDDGWSKQDDLFAINPDLDMEEVMAYAKSKNVKIMLWVIWNTFEKQEEAAWKQFEEWGISGIKFDFMNRDDQKMVQFYHRIAAEAAKRRMVLDFHGAYKPAGLRRMYPNVLTREALIEFEYNGWTKHDTPEHHNLLPYIRLVTGPADYIPYTTNNVTVKNFRPVGDRPMGMGTRAHSMAMFVIMASPMQMLPDSPSDYYREKECTEFISNVPVEWDDLRVLEAKTGEYTILARKEGDDWYIGAIINKDAREFEISFDFLDNGVYQMEFIEDGINADTRAIDYRRKTIKVTNKDTQKIILAPAGGWIARIIKGL